MKRMAVAFIGLLCAGSAVGQTVEALDLRVPEPPLYAAAGPASGDPPGTYYGDTTGRPSRRDDARDFTEDDRKARVWGSVTTGIGHSEGYGTSHYNAAEVNVSKPFGDGERPSNLNLQIRVEQSDGPGFGDRTLYPRYRSDPYFPPR